MKFNNIKIITFLVICIALINLSFSIKNLAKSHTHNEHKSQKMKSHMKSHRIFVDNDSKFYAKFSKMANCARKPIKQSCPTCMNPGADYKLFFFLQINRLKKFPFKFLIHYNDKIKQVVISFGGPKVETYVKQLYTGGWSLNKADHFKIEKEYNHVYYDLILKPLKEKIEKIKKSGRHGYKYVFTGYSVGGSIATLASLDMVRNKVLSRSHNDVTVFTFGALRIGDSRFVIALNESVTLYKIVKDDDFVTRAPNCYYSPIGRIWRCLDQTALGQRVLQKNYPMRTYYQRYYSRRPLYKSPMSFLEKKQHIKGGQPAQESEKEKKEKERREQEMKKKLEEKQKERERESRQHRQHQQEQSHNQQHQQQHQQHQQQQHQQHNTEHREVHNQQHNTEQHKEQHNTQHREQHNTQQVAQAGAKAEEMNRQHANEQSDRSDRTGAKPPSPIGRPGTAPTGQQQQQQHNNGGSQIVPPTETSTTTVMGGEYGYLSKVYYTQPMGIQISYNPNFSKFVQCRYINGISNCERRLKLPESFDGSVHRVYYGVNMDAC